MRQVAELENVIAAVEAVAGEEADRERRSGCYFRVGTMAFVVS
ncbi:hypothetical protein [Methylobacterium sp. J-077]|nr:hypothetical protein [Methylobacterium sp. J-077]